MGCHHWAYRVPTATGVVILDFHRGQQAQGSPTKLKAQFVFSVQQRLVTASQILLLRLLEVRALGRWPAGISKKHVVQDFSSEVTKMMIQA